MKTKLVEEKNCTLIFNEIAIKSWLEMDERNQMVENFEDLGHLGSKNKFATQTRFL